MRWNHATLMNSLLSFIVMFCGILCVLVIGHLNARMTDDTNFNCCILVDFKLHASRTISICVLPHICQALHHVEAVLLENHQQGTEDKIHLNGEDCLLRRFWFWPLPPVPSGQVWHPSASYIQVSLSCPVASLGAPPYQASRNYGQKAEMFFLLGSFVIITGGIWCFAVCTHSFLLWMIWQIKARLDHWGLEQPNPQCVCTGAVLSNLSAFWWTELSVLTSLWYCAPVMPFCESLPRLPLSGFRIRPKWNE